MSALDTQVGGSHYTDQKLQPIQLTYLLGQTPAFCKVAKYCSRIKDDMEGQVDKAIHCNQLQAEFSDTLGMYNVVSTTDADNLIVQFTEDRFLQDALLAMHCQVSFPSEIEHYTKVADDALKSFKKNLK